MQYAVSTPSNDHGYVAPGIQCEGVLTSYWLSAPDITEFSGAVNKVKGDDNDTCNALTNGQAAYGIYDLIGSFGTSDFEHTLGDGVSGWTMSARTSRLVWPCGLFCGVVFASGSTSTWAVLDGPRGF